MRVRFQLTAGYVPFNGIQHLKKVCTYLKKVCNFNPRSSYFKKSIANLFNFCYNGKNAISIGNTF